MLSRSRAALPILLSALAGMALGAPVGSSVAEFSGTTATEIDFTAAPDWVPPAVERAVAGKAGGGEPGFIRSGSGYYLYAQLSDAGNPASGVSSVTADVSDITTGAISAPLVAGTFSSLGESYNYRSAILTSGSSLSQGPLSFTISASDAAANQMPANQRSVIVDDTPPAGTEIATTNGGDVAGAPDAGDTVIYTFSERLDPTTVKADWRGAEVAILIKILDGGAEGSDRLIAYELGGNAQLALGVLDLKRPGYVSEDVSFGSTAVPSKIEQSGQRVILTLGAPQGLTSVATGTASMTLDPGSLSDPAGNPLPSTLISQSAARDGEF